MKIPAPILAVAGLTVSAVAGDVAGTCKSRFDSPIGTRKCNCTLRRDGSELSTSEKANGLSVDFTREFPLYSIMVLKLKAK